MKKDMKLLDLNFPSLDESLLEAPDLNRLLSKKVTLHPPRLVLLYGSLITQ